MKVAGDGRVDGTLSPTAWGRLHELCLRGLWLFPDDDDTRALVEAGFAERTADGLRVLAAGIETYAGAARLPEGSDTRSAVQEAYERFLAFDVEVKRAVTDWQLGGYASASHLDADGWAIVDRVQRIHDRVSPVLRSLHTALPRVAEYRARLAQALRRLEADGELAYLSGLTVDSYHTLWWHLHQELLWALGIDRSDDPNQ
jgi:hypothetical protein